MWTTQTLSESRSKHVLKRSVDALKQLAAFKAVQRQLKMVLGDN
jgi:hypothetical protein